jgi:hypothetical protein
MGFGRFEYEAASSAVSEKSLETVQWYVRQTHTNSVYPTATLEGSISRVMYHLSLSAWISEGAANDAISFSIGLRRHFVPDFCRLIDKETNQVVRRNVAIG